MKTQKLLRRLRRAIRSLYLAHGLMIVALYASVLLALVYVGDRLLDYPLELRWIQIVLFGALSAYVVHRFLVRPAFRTPIRDDDLAVLIERTHPHLHERFITVLQAQRNPAIRSSADPRFLALLEEKLVRDLSTLRARRVLRLQGVVRRAGLTALALGLVALGAVHQREYLGIFWRRLAGMDVPWPRRTTLFLTLRDREGQVLEARLEDGTVVPAHELRLGTFAVEIPRFNSMRVEIRAEGIVPETALLRTAGDRADEVTRGTREQAGADFLHTYRDVARDFSFWVTAGDDDDRHPTVRVTTYEPPVIRGLWADVEPPAYLPPVLRERLAAVLPHGNVKALQGSSATVHVLVEGVVQRAVAACEPAPSAAWERQELERTTLDAPPPAEVWRGDDWERFTVFRLAGLPITGESTYQVRLHLFDKKGRRSERPNTYLVTPERDDPPLVSLRLLGAPGGAVSQQGSLLAVVEAVDLYDVAEAAVQALDERVERTGDGERTARWSHALLPSPAASAVPLDARRRDGRTHYALHLREDLETLAASGLATEAGAVLTLQATARDAQPQARTTRSAPAHVNVLELTDYLRVLERHLKELRAEAEALRLREAEFLATVRTIRRAIADAGAESSWSREDLRFDRYPHDQDANRIATRFSTVLQGVLLNRIGSDIGEAGGATANPPTSRERRTREIAALEAVCAEVFGAAGVTGGQPLAETQWIFLDLEILRRLGRDPQAISTQTATRSLLAIGGDLSRLVDAHYPAVRAHAEALIELEGATAVLERLNELERDQSVLLEALTKILDALNRWDSFESILLDWRKATDGLARYRRLLEGTDR